MAEHPWLKGDDPDLAAERSLLESLAARKPAPGTREQGWVALGAAIPGLAATASTAEVAAGASQSAAASGASAAAAKAGAGSLIAKILVGVSVIGAGAYWITGSVSESELPPVRAVVEPAIDEAPEPTPQAPSPMEAAEPERAAKPSPEVAAPLKRAQRPAAATSTASTLAEESRLLARARKLIQSGSAGQALEVLAESRSRFPRSILHQEREVLTIEALAKSGSTGAAKARADKFLERYPKSAHADKVRAFTQ